MTNSTQKAKLGYQRGKFMLETAEGRLELPENLMLDTAQLKMMVGKEVEVIKSEPVPGVIGVNIPNMPIPNIPVQQCYFILCYYPPPPWMEGQPYLTPVVDKESRVQIANKLLEQGAISAETHAKLIS